MPSLSNLLVRTLHWLPRSLIRRVAGRYIAGENLEDLLGVVSAIRRERLLATADVLGENVSTEDAAGEATEEYLRLIDGLNARDLSCEVSIKPTIVGLRLGEHVATRNLDRIATRAAELRVALALDMEDSSTTDATLRLYRYLAENHGNVGLALQAYLERSVKDLEGILPLRPRVRVCKGIYVEPEGVTLRDRGAIRESFLCLVNRLLEGGGFPAIATHDPWLVDRSLESLRRRGMGPESHEFQMLLGAGEGLHGRIRAAGSALRLYCPYGPEWYAYSLRRLQENPKIALYVSRGLLSPRALRRRWAP